VYVQARNGAITAMLLRAVTEVLCCPGGDAAVSREVDKLAATVTGGSQATFWDKGLKAISRSLHTRAQECQAGKRSCLCKQQASSFVAKAGGDEALHVINASKQGCSNLLVSEKRLRGMHRHLAGDWEEANLALRVLTTTAARGPQHANALLRGLDWDHKALAKLAKPTRCGFQGEWLLPAPQLVHVLLVIAPLWGALELHVRMSKGWCRLVPSTCRPAKGDAISDAADANPKKQPPYVAYARFLITMLHGCQGANRARFISLRWHGRSHAVMKCRLHVCCPDVLHIIEDCLPLRRWCLQC
jgi:hypothetical protein